MTELFFTSESNAHRKLSEILEERTGHAPEILKTGVGKPFLDGNPLCFSISHSGGRAVIAVSSRPVGVDIELCRGKRRPVIEKSFPDDEKSEINSERDFLAHWTAREAFIKKRGLTLAGTLRKLAFVKGEMYLDGVRQSEEIEIYNIDRGVLAVCTEKI